MLAQRGDTRAGIAPATMLRRRIDRADANAVRCRIAIGRERDRRAAILPEVAAARWRGKVAVHPVSRVEALNRPQRLSGKRTNPTDQQLAVSLAGTAVAARHA